MSVPSCFRRVFFKKNYFVDDHRQLGPLGFLYRRLGTEGRQRKDQPANPGVFSPIAYNHLVTSGVPLPCRCILIQHKPTCYHEHTTTKRSITFYPAHLSPRLVAFWGNTPCHTRVVSAHPLASDLIAPPSSAHLLPRSLIAQTSPTSRTAIFSRCAQLTLLALSIRGGLELRLCTV